MAQQYQYSILGISTNVQFGKNSNRIVSGTNGFEFRNDANTAFVSIFGLRALFEPGSLSSPAFSFNGDTDTGFFSPSSNQVSVATGGVLSARFQDPATGTTVFIDGTGSMRVPSGTTAQRPSTPSVGMLRVNTTLNTLEIYSGSSWEILNTQVSSGFGDGSASSPSGYFTADTDTGFYRPGANQFGISTGGTLRLNVTDTQIVAAARILSVNGTSSEPTYSFSSETGTGIYRPAANQLGVTVSSNDSAIFRPGNTSSNSVLTILGSTSITLPGGTNSERPTTTVAGMIRYNTTSNLIEFYNGTTWIDLGSTNIGFSDGTAASPSGYFVSDTDTGFYRPGANQFAISTGGTQRANFTDTAVTTTVPVRANNGTVTEPSFSFSSETNSGVFRPASNQVAITVNGNQSALFNPGNTTANSVLVVSGNTSITLPSGTTAQRPSSPAVGMFRFNTTLNELEFYDGTNWVSVSAFSGFADGTASAPSIYFQSDTDTGFFRPGANQIGVTTNGTQRATFTDTAFNTTVPVRVNNGTAASPSISFTSQTDAGLYLISSSEVGVAVSGLQSVVFRPNNITSDSVVTINGNTSITIPSGTTAQRPGTPATGMIRFNTTLTTLEVYDGTNWVNAGGFNGFADGTVTSPGGYFTSETNTGIYRPAANQFAISVNGVQRANLTTTSLTTTVPYRAPNGSATEPSYSFSSETNTGVYLSATNQLSVSINGTQTVAFNVSTAGELVSFIGNTSIRIPTGTTAQRPSSPTEGMFRYNTTLTDLEFYNGTSWISVTSSSSVWVGNDPVTRIVAAKSFT